jgi:hypothetical protein
MPRRSRRSGPGACASTSTGNPPEGTTPLPAPGTTLGGQRSGRPTDGGTTCGTGSDSSTSRCWSRSA